MRRLLLLALALLTFAPAASAQNFTRADTLRGSFTTPGRAWWDVSYYDLEVQINPADSSIAGRNHITYRVLRPATELQIDLMTPLEVDSRVQDGRRLRFRRDGNAFFATVDRAPATLGRRLHLGARQPGTRVGRDDRPGHGRQRVVAEQGHAGG